MVRTITAAAALTIAGSAMAVPTGAHWEMVDNATNPTNGLDTGLSADWMTFDLFVDLEPGDVVGAIDFGIAGGNAGLSTDGTFFQNNDNGVADSANDNINAPAFVQNFLPSLYFDTAVAMNTESLSFAAAMDWNEAGVTGAWFSASQNQVGGPLWVARITVSNLNAAGTDATGFLGGQIFVSGTGPSGNFGQDLDNIALGVVDLPNAKIPTPGALALFGLAGAAATRRRR